MKLILSFVVFAVIVSLFADSEALPARKRMVYYQQPAQWFAGPQQMMYLHYVQPSPTHARSTQAASALVSGESVATGTYLKDCDHSEAELAAVGPAVAPVSGVADDEIAAAGAHAASSVAEAYPEANAGEITAAEIEASQLPSDDAAKAPRDFQFEKEQNEGAINENSPALVPLAPLAPVEPSKSYLPADNNKKVYVELEETQPEETQQQEENAVVVPQNAESDDDDDEESYVPAKYPNRRPITTRKPNKGSAPKPLPAGTFFPINFGGTSGGAIAIANSFSTGEGGSATSHAVAYGSPDAARARGQPVRRH